MVRNPITKACFYFSLGDAFMGLLDWLFRRKPPSAASAISHRPSNAGEREEPRSSGTTSAGCLQCGTTVRQTRADGRCLSCGALLPDELRTSPVSSTPPEHSGAPQRRKLPRPANVQQLGENSPMVAFEQGNQMVVMDRDAFDYTYGDADGPDPAQRDLDTLLPKVTRVCVLAGAMFRGRAMTGKVLLELSDLKGIQELVTCLRIVEDPRSFGHCACLGGPTMELYAGLELVATI